MEPIDIQKQKPSFGQRCNVFDIRYQCWIYAYWTRTDDGKGKFIESIYGNERRVFVSHWMPEPGHPGI